MVNWLHIIADVTSRFCRTRQNLWSTPQKTQDFPTFLLHRSPNSKLKLDFMERDLKGSVYLASDVTKPVLCFSSSSSSFYMAKTLQTAAHKLILASRAPCSFLSCGVTWKSAKFIFPSMIISAFFASTKLIHKVANLHYKRAQLEPTVCQASHGRIVLLHQGP